MPVDGSPTITYPHYTNKGLDEGLFDQLMVAVEYHLQKEYKAGRISGDTYHKVYLGSLESAMGNATQYLLGTLLIGEKRDQLNAQIELSQEQARQLAYETDFILPQTLLKLIEETALLVKQQELVDKQMLKIDKEIEFLTAKILSELANTDETIADANSLIGRQINLLRIQGLGFAGDLESKAAKINADYDAVFQSIQEAPDASTPGSNTITGVIGILETVEKMKDDTYIDPVFTPPVVFVPVP